VKVPEDPTENVGNQEFLEKLALLVKKENLDQPDLPENRVAMELMVNVEIQDKLEPLDPEELKENKVHQESVELPVTKD